MRVYMHVCARECVCVRVCMNKVEWVIEGYCF